MANQTLSENALNEDPPQNLVDFITALNSSVNEYTASIDSYLELANATLVANELGEAVINTVREEEWEEGREGRII